MNCPKCTIKPCEIVCPSCASPSCITCLETYLVSECYTSMHCMDCQIYYEPDWITDTFSAPFLKRYKDAKIDFLLQKERNLLPATQPAARHVKTMRQNEILISFYQDKIKELILENQDLDKQCSEPLSNQYTSVPCLALNCNGYLSTNGNCGVCGVSGKEASVTSATSLPSCCDQPMVRLPMEKWMCVACDQVQRKNRLPLRFPIQKWRERVNKTGDGDSSRARVATTIQEIQFRLLPRYKIQTYLNQKNRITFLIDKCEETFIKNIKKENIKILVYQMYVWVLEYYLAVVTAIDLTVPLEIELREECNRLITQHAPKCPLL